MLLTMRHQLIRLCHVKSVVRLFLSFFYSVFNVSLSVHLKMIFKRHTEKILNSELGRMWKNWAKPRKSFRIENQTREPPSTTTTPPQLSVSS